MSQQERKQEKDYHEGRSEKQNLGNQDQGTFQRQQQKQRQPGKENIQHGGKQAEFSNPNQQKRTPLPSST